MMIIIHKDDEIDIGNYNNIDGINDTCTMKINEKYESCLYGFSYFLLRYHLWFHMKRKNYFGYRDKTETTIGKHTLHILNISFKSVLQKRQKKSKQ